ncbi:hypothetical protein J6590_085831 [Homalodisca vitripennis]|nr:hypothetical protein J6590_085831 [Homalodisca vitripennis]
MLTSTVTQKEGSLQQDSYRRAEMSTNISDVRYPFTPSSCLSPRLVPSQRLRALPVERMYAYVLKLRGEREVLDLRPFPTAVQCLWLRKAIDHFNRLVIYLLSESNLM